MAKVQPEIIANGDILHIPFQLNDIMQENKAEKTFQHFSLLNMPSNLIWERQITFT